MQKTIVFQDQALCWARRGCTGFAQQALTHSRHDPRRRTVIAARPSRSAGPALTSPPHPGKRMHP